METPVFIAKKRWKCSQYPQYYRINNIKNKKLNCHTATPDTSDRLGDLSNFVGCLCRVFVVERESALRTQQNQIGVYKPASLGLYVHAGLCTVCYIHIHVISDQYYIRSYFRKAYLVRSWPIPSKWNRLLIPSSIFTSGTIFSCHYALMGSGSHPVPGSEKGRSVTLTNHVRPSNAGVQDEWRFYFTLPAWPNGWRFHTDETLNFFSV